jgi:hypothetical protein
MPFHFNSSLLGPGSIILSGNWGRIVQLIGTQHREWERERILEEIRKAEFPDLPSRLECIFYFRSRAEAELYRMLLATNARLMVLYEVQLLDPYVPQHVADWKGTGPYDESKEWARRYWRGDIMPDQGPKPGPLCRETLAVVPLRVLQKVPSTELETF